MSHNENDYCLCHHGIKGMHWGVRRYQNEDGTLTAAGKARLNAESNTYHNEYSNSENNKNGSVDRNGAPSNNSRNSSQNNSYDTTATKDSQRPTSINYKKLITIGAATAAGIGAGIYIYKNRDKIAATALKGKEVAKHYAEIYTKEAKDYIKSKPQEYKELLTKKADELPGKAKAFIERKEKAFITRAEQAVDKAIDKAIDGAVAAAGAYVVTKILDKKGTIDSGENATNSDKLKAYMLQSAADVVRGSTRATVPNTTNSQSSANKSDADAKTFNSSTPNPYRAGIAALGQSPARTPIDKQSPAYANLFKTSDGSIRSDSQRSAIKELVNQGYSVSQIQSIIYKTEGN